MKKATLAHLGLLIANVIYGANYSVAGAVMKNYVPPFAFILLRVSVACLLFFITAQIVKPEKVDKKDFPLLILCALSGVAVNQLLFFKGLSFTTPINASIMMVCTPIIVLIIGLISREEHFSFIRLIGIMLGFAGALYLILKPSMISSGLSFNSGDVLVLLNASSWGIYLVLVKSLMKKYHTLTVVKWTFAFGFIFVFPVAISDFNQVNWFQLPAFTWLQIAFVVLVVTYIAYILNTFALKAVDASVVGTYIYLQPILATGFALISGSDQPTWHKAISCILIFSGVYLSAHARFKNKKAQVKLK